MAEYNPETHVAIPKTALVKLKTDRINLFKTLEDHKYFGPDSKNYFRISTIVALTSNMWQIANRKIWD